MPDWPRELAGYRSGDETLPADLPDLNVVLNRARLAEFLRRFADDSDVRDFLILDVLSVAADAEISSTGEVEDWPALALRPFRLWEYVWLYKALGLYEPGRRVLDLGGPASHIAMAAALSGNTVHSIDINPRIVEAGRQCAALLNLSNYTAEVGDMRDLGHMRPGSFDRIMCCSVLEHLTGEDQRIALGEMAKALAPGGIIGLTFDYGPPAPGANIYLPPPHEPPTSPEDVRHRYVHSGLEIIGDSQIEAPIPGSLFHDDTVRYTMSALFLGKRPIPQVAAPTPVIRQSSLISQVQISELPDRLNRKIFAQSSSAQQTAAQLEVQDRALAERLSELEKVSDEAGRRAAAIDLMTAEMRELHAAGDARLRMIEQLDNERQVQQQAAQERLRAMEETGAALGHALSEIEMLKAKCVGFENENLLTHLQRRRKIH
ncbi:MAG: methyltransferase domain-containing protein [Acidobacteriota bacterium]|nr:methyltransferase domain-containing protein [Acidobacteriota bacterium]